MSASPASLFASDQATLSRIGADADAELADSHATYRACCEQAQAERMVAIRDAWVAWRCALANGSGHSPRLLAVALLGRRTAVAAANARHDRVVAEALRAHLEVLARIYPLL